MRIFDTNVQRLKYTVLMVVMTAVLSLRYGQGTDYFNYSDLYDMYSSFELAIKNPYNHYMEFLFRLICALFNTLGFSFCGFVAVVSLFNMFCLNRFLKEYSKNPIFSLLLFYPTFYLTYFFSIIRQAIVLSVFLVVILYFIGVVYVKNNIFYVNPLLNIMGYSFYDIVYLDNDGSKKEKRIFYKGELKIDGGYYKLYFPSDTDKTVRRNGLYRRCMALSWC